MQLMIFCVLTVALAWLCRKQLINPRCHGFYRFFAFLGIAWLLVYRASYWQDSATSLHQILSTVLMFLSLAMVVASFLQFWLRGGRRDTDRPVENFEFENTSELVTTGIYKYIRHPMYTSLLLLAWGIFLKQFTWPGLVVVVGVSLALYQTARIEERENRAFFGAAYDQYCQFSKRFLPFLM